MTRTTFDGFALFTAIGTNPKAFAVTAALVDQAAPKILFAALKHKDLTLPVLTAVRASIGQPTFDLALDTLGDTDLKKVLKKIDAHWDTKKADSDSLRAHIVALANGRATPSAKPEKPPKKPKAAKPTKASADEATWPSAMSAKPARRSG
jgi:hypothetical protein